MKRFAMILLLIIMTAVTLVSCNRQTEPPKEEEDIPAVTEDASDTNVPEPETEAPEPAPSASYEWVVEPKATEGDIQPVYDIMTGKIYSCEASFLNRGTASSLICYDGEIKADLPAEGYSYCSGCSYITNHFYTVDLTNYEVVENPIGHGGGSFSPYIYDKETGELFSQAMGDFLPAEVQRAIVSISTRRPLTQDEMDFGAYGADYAYENSEGYGIYIDGKLVLDGFDMYIPYSCGVTALRKNGRWGYYDYNGNEIFPCEYDSASVESYDYDYNPTTVPYHATEGVIVLNKGGKWAFADVEGNMLTDFEFEAARPVYDGKAWVKTADGWGVVELHYDYTEDESITSADNNSCSVFVC